MRFYQRILLVAGLTIGMIAAGVAWERFYVSPLVEQAQRKPDPPDSAGTTCRRSAWRSLPRWGRHRRPWIRGRKGRGRGESGLRRTIADRRR